MQEIIVSVLTSTVTSGIGIAILKIWLEKACAKQLETHKSTLSLANEKEIASFKHKLELAAAERNFRFSHVFERTAEVIVEVYLKLLEFRDAVSELQYTASPPEDINATLLEKAREKREAVQNYFAENKIYIPKPTAKLIMDFYKMQYAATVAYTAGKTMPGTVSERYNDLYELNKQTPKLLGQLEDDFQKLLGFPTDEQLA